MRRRTGAEVPFPAQPLSPCGGTLFSGLYGGGLIGSINRPFDHLEGLDRIAPAFDLDPFPGFQILLVFEEMVDLVDQDLVEFMIDLDLAVVCIKCIYVKVEY